MYKALLYDLSGRSLVAVKTLKGKQHLLVRLSDVKEYAGMFSSSDVKCLAEESQIMAKFDHPNVMKLLGVSINMNKNLLVILPFMANGSLLAYLRKNRAGLTVKNADMTEMVKEGFIKGD